MGMAWAELARYLGGAFALYLVLEGLLPFINPGAWRRVFERALRLTDAQIRVLGLASLALGVGLLLVLAP